MSEVIKVTPSLIRSLIIPRSTGSKKGDNGIVLIVGGSRIYHGAPILSSLAAMRAGTDLVYTAIPRSNVMSARAMSPNAIVLPLADDKLTIGSARRLTSMLPKRPNSAAVGMGMTIAKPEALVSLVKGLRQIGTRILLDAAALIPDILDDITGTETIVTPHPGEYKRIFGEDAGKVEAEQAVNIQKMCKKYQITIVLKGPLNLICGSDKMAIIKRTTPAMTVGGTGDVLSGLAAGFLSKMNPFEACILGVYFNGIAASSAFNRVGLHMLATDIIEQLPCSLKDFDLIE